jgi:hypothetical protein
MKIQFTKQVIFHDLDGNVTASFAVGDTIELLGKSINYFITPIGNIWRDEAKEVLDISVGTAIVTA